MCAPHPSISASSISSSSTSTASISTKRLSARSRNLFFREDYRRVYIDDIGAIEVLSNDEVLHRYLEGFYKTVDVDSIRKRKFQLVVDYAHSSTMQLLPGIFNRLGCEVIVLNTNVDQSSKTLTLDELNKEMNRLATITVTSNNSMGIRHRSRWRAHHRR